MEGIAMQGVGLPSLHSTTTQNAPPNAASEERGTAEKLEIYNRREESWKVPPLVHQNLPSHHGHVALLSD